MEKFLKQEIFKGISDTTVEKILNLNYRKAYYPAGELIRSKGDLLDEFIIVLSGCIKTNDFTYSGKELNSSYFFSGDAFPFYLVYGGYTHYPWNVYCFKKAEVVIFPKDELMNVAACDPVFLLNVLKFVSEYTCYNKLLLRTSQYYKVSEKLAFWLLEINPDQYCARIPNSQEVLADMLMVNRSSLNQELKHLEEKQIIKRDRKKIKILNREYLENLL